MTLTEISRHSKINHKIFEERMKKEALKKGLDPWGDIAQEKFAHRMTNFEQCALENSKDDPEIMLY